MTSKRVLTSPEIQDLSGYHNLWQHCKCQNLYCVLQQTEGPQKERSLQGANGWEANHNLKKKLCFHREKNQLSVFPSRVLLGQILKLWYLWGKCFWGDNSLECPSHRGPVQAQVLQYKGLWNLCFPAFLCKLSNLTHLQMLQIVHGPVQNM